MEREPEGPVTPSAHGPDSGVDPSGVDPEEPTTTGTLFIMILFLMALAGMWGIMYLTLLNR